MDARVGGFSCGVEAGKRATSAEIGLDSTHHVVCSWADGRHVRGEIEAVAEAGRVDPREALLQKFGGFGSHIEIDVFGLSAVHFADDGASDDVARSELLGFGVALHKAFEIDVAEDAAFAAQGFGEQKARRAFYGESRGMELHEFHIGENGSGFVSDGHAVACGDFGIGGFAIDLAEAAGGEKDGSSANFVG